MTIAITGASGFVGSYVAERLSFPQRRLSRKAQANPATAVQCEWISGDLRNNGDIQALVHEAPVLVHLACSSNPRTSNQNVTHDLDQNLIPSLRLFEAFVKANPGGHIIFASSGGNMYDATSQAIRTETDIPHPRSGYAVHKLAIENYLRLFCELYKVSATILRISNPYGTLLSPKRGNGLIGVAFAKLLASEELHVIDSLASVRDYLHLEDVAKAFCLVIENPPPAGECRLYNVSSGIGFTNAAVLGMVEKAAGKSIKKHYPLPMLPAPTWSVLSSAKIERELGWQPTIGLEDGIKNMWESNRPA